MIHEVFEKVNYGEVLEAASPDELLRANGPALALVKEHLNRFRIVPQSDEERYGACVKESLRWVWNALQLRLPIGGGFQLGSLSKEDRQHESEFFYPIPKAGELGLSDGELSGLEISNSKRES
ncbi:MAG: hypothetical protein H6751_07370 [Candidatus Omnitrophica bacterium]|nr:hypothetical protein [Candidatus Omnitrophota bacterium]